MNEDCQRKYEFNSYSKEQILKVTKIIVTELQKLRLKTFANLFSNHKIH